MEFARYLSELRVELRRLRSGGPHPVPDNLVVLERIGSTNQLARAIVADYEQECQNLPAVLLLAFEQTAGRGRLGRTWSSPAGRGVYASRTLQATDPEHLQTLPLLVGVGLCRALDRYLTATHCRLKWPNDLLVDGKKIGGILIETVVRPGECAFAVIGFGVNLSQAAADLPHERATSLWLETGAEVSLAACTWDLVTAVEAELQHLGDAAYAVQGYRERSVHQVGDHLTCRVGEERVTGIVRGFDERGMLLLTTADGERRLTAGEVVED